MKKGNRLRAAQAQANLFEPLRQPPPIPPPAVAAEFLPALAQLFLRAVRPEPPAKEENSRE